MADNTDESKLQVLNTEFAVECMGDIDTAKMFFKQFNDETLIKNLKEINEAWKSQDLKAMKDTSHNGKGVSS